MPSSFPAARGVGLARDGDGTHAWHSAHRCTRAIGSRRYDHRAVTRYIEAAGSCPETLELLKQQGVGVHVLPTQDAVDLYNDLRKTEQAPGLFHTTC